MTEGGAWHRRQPSWPRSLLSPIDVVTVADAYDVDDEVVVDDLIDDPEVTDSHPVGRTLTAENNAPRRPRLVGQQVDRRSDSLLICTT